MAFLPVFPLKKRISFLPQGKFAQAGILPETTATRTLYNQAQEPIWTRLAAARLRVAEAKRKFLEASPKGLQNKKDAKSTIDSYRLQFRLIDLNNDGLIDFKELCQVLDEIGDKCSEEERTQHFQEVDTDHSGAIDFEEFLELIERVLCGSAASSIVTVCTSTHSEAQDVMCIGQLSLAQQIQYGLF